MTRQPACRRTHPRYTLRAHRSGRLEFGYPRPQDPPCVMGLWDISQGGLAFVLRHELPGLEVGDSIDGVRVQVGDRVVHGDLLVMRLSPDASAGPICGALFYPGDDADLLTLREVLRDLEARQGESIPASS